MKSNLKEQVEGLQSSVDVLTKRVETLQNRLENYLVVRLQKHDNELIEFNTALKQLDTAFKQSKPEIVVEELEDDSK